MIRRTRRLHRRIKELADRLTPRRGKVVAPDGTTWWVSRTWLPHGNERDVEPDAANVGFPSGSGGGGSGDFSGGDFSGGDWHVVGGGHGGGDGGGGGGGDGGGGGHGGGGGGGGGDLGDDLLIGLAVVVVIVMLVLFAPFLIALVAALSELLFLVVLLPFAVLCRFAFGWPWRLVVRDQNGQRLAREVKGFRACGYEVRRTREALTMGARPWAARP